MFKTLHFFHGLSGERLDSPTILKASYLHSKEFVLETIESYGHSAVSIERVIKSVKGDPYNDDGRPATVCCVLVLPHVTFMGGSVDIIGYERANLCWAGHALAPYYEGVTNHCPPSQTLGRHEFNKAPVQFHDLRRQHVRLTLK